MDKLFVISRYAEDTSWIEETLDNYKIIQSTAGHEATMLKYICENYRNLPDVIVFLQAYPFDHCPRGRLLTLINNNTFTPLEMFRVVPENSWQKISEDNGFMEINNSWYIAAHYESKGIRCKYGTYDEFMRARFSDYEYLQWLRFAPGTQYVVEKDRIEFYTESFWKNLLAEVPEYARTESFMIERAMYYIFSNVYKEKL